MQPWLPVPASVHKIPSTTELPPSPVEKTQKRVGGKPSNTSLKQVKPKTAAFSFSADALPHLKAAMEVSCISAAVVLLVCVLWEQFYTRSE